MAGPRVTEKDVQNAVLEEHYFTALQGARMAVLDYVSEVGNNAPPSAPLSPQLGLLTFCVLVLSNGYTVVGKSACASPENFSAVYGRDLARKDAERQIWPLLGFMLRDRLAYEEHERYQQQVMAQFAGAAFPGTGDADGTQYVGAPGEPVSAVGQNSLDVEPRQGPALTEADALADLAGTPRPDYPTPPVPLPIVEQNPEPAVEVYPEAEPAYMDDPANVAAEMSAAEYRAQLDDQPDEYPEAQPTHPDDVKPE